MEKEKGETEPSEKRVTRSMAKEKSEETMLGKVTKGFKRWMLGQAPMPEGVETETEETAEATFEAVRNSRKSDQITVR